MKKYLWPFRMMGFLAFIAVAIYCGIACYPAISDTVTHSNMTPVPENGRSMSNHFTENDETASIWGRVLRPNGEGIRNARVMLSGEILDEPKFVFTDASGNYSFVEVPVGSSY